MVKFSLENQLGYYVGEYIIAHQLPTLETDSLKTRKVIPVPREDGEENVRLETEWFNLAQKDRNGESKEWKAYVAHNKYLQEKYLPHKLKCYVPPFEVENIEEFKKGLIAALWDCDLCVYSLKPENIIVDCKSTGWHSCIELVLGSTVND